MRKLSIKCELSLETSGDEETGELIAAFQEWLLKRRESKLPVGFTGPGKKVRLGITPILVTTRDGRTK